MIKCSLTAAAAAMVFAAGCTQGANYGRPVVTPPEAFRGAGETTVDASASIADQRWSSLFEDEALRDLITTALENNYDLQIAAARILQTQAQYGVTRSQRFPTVSAQGTAQVQHGSVINGESLPTIGLGQFTLNASWEPDFWGKYKRANEAARADILASEWGQRASLTSVIGQVATGYFNLRALDSELEISRRTVATREESLRLTEVRERGGATSLVDVRQAEGLVLTARASQTCTSSRSRTSSGAWGAEPFPYEWSSTSRSPHCRPFTRRATTSVTKPSSSSWTTSAIRWRWNIALILAVGSSPPTRDR